MSFILADYMRLSFNDNRFNTGSFPVVINATPLRSMPKIKTQCACLMSKLAMETLSTVIPLGGQAGVDLTRTHDVFVHMEDERLTSAVTAFIESPGPML